jgi:hypothetical protein
LKKSYNNYIIIKVFPTNSHGMSETCSSIIHLVDPTEEFYDQDPLKWKNIVETLFMKTLILANNLKFESIAIPILDLCLKYFF